MQDSFLERFYSTQRTVGITELTQTEQRGNEKATDFINRWRNLSLHCPQPITEQEAVRMCMNNLNPDMAVYLQGVRPLTFEELASKDTDIENYMQFVTRRSKPYSKPIEKSNPRDKPTFKPKQAHAMEATATIPSLHVGGAATRNNEHNNTMAGRRPTLIERQNREYSFPAEEVHDLFAGLRELNLIELPKSKRPEESAKVNEPNFCHYHRILGHTLKDCFVVKNIIQKLIDEGTVDADLLKSFKKSKKMAANIATIEVNSVSSASSNMALPYSQQAMMPKPEFSPMIFSGCGRYGEEQQTYQHRLRTEAYNRWLHSTRPPCWTRQRSQEREQQRRRRSALQRLTINGETLLFPPAIYQNDERRDDDFQEDFDVHAIEIFEEDGEPLYFPGHESPEVDQVQLRSGRQLVDVRPPAPKNPRSKDVASDEVADLPPNVSVKYDVISHLKKIPAMLSVYDALCLSSDLRKAFITVLSFPEDYRVEVSQTEVESTEVLDVTFTDEDLLLGSKKHNRPLLMYGQIDDLSINRIMVDGGSAINLLPLRTLERIGYSRGDLSRSNVVIHGFNQAGQEAMGTISLVLKLASLSTYETFHVIDAATSYNALLGRLWLHENQVVPSTLHQCIKYKDKSGETIRIFADERPFTVAESFYADAKFYIEPVEKIEKTKPVATLEPGIMKGNPSECSSDRKIYQYIPSEQRREDDPIFRIISKSSSNQGIEFPIPLSHLIQRKINEAHNKLRKSSTNTSKNKNKNVTHITLTDERDIFLPISLYDAKVLYMMQKMGYDTLTGPSLCNGWGQLAPFEKILSQAQLKALREGKELKDKKYELGYEVCMTSSMLIDTTAASPQMDDGNQPTVDELEEINIGYNQIKMALEDEELTAFRTPKGIYCYRVMPFGLKNAGATYQRAMTVVLDGLLYEIVECYIDDIVVKSKHREDHLQHLAKVFERLRKHKLKVNPMKCAFGVLSGKFLGFIVTKKGIQIDPTKIEAIVKMPAPVNLHKLKSLQACQNAFNDIKEYLINPHVLSAPVKGRPHILYTAAMPASLGALLAQTNDEGKETALYYLSRTLVGVEYNYPDMENICLALVFAAQKLRHYMLEHTIYLVSRADPLRYILNKMILSGRLAKWAMFLSQFDITFIPQKSIKGQALANFLAAHPIPDNFPIDDDLPGEEVFTTSIADSSWKMYFDGACRRSGAGAGVVFVTPTEDIIPYSFTLTTTISNNAAEYEALIIGLEIALNMGLDTLYVYGDSQLIINQLTGTYTIKKEGLMPYLSRAKQLVAMFTDWNIQHIVRSQNERADALASLAASMALNDDKTLVVQVEERRVLPILTENENKIPSTTMVTNVYEIETGDWRTPFLDYFLHGYLPLEAGERSRF
uniref:RNA-directed DNA polymerase n=1 Tax=Oryza brachyantha TaxID=4533 RepID=J3MCF0_ORYBR